MSCLFHTIDVIASHLVLCKTYDAPSFLFIHITQTEPLQTENLTNLKTENDDPAEY